MGISFIRLSFLIQSNLHSFLCTAANWDQYCVYITDAGPGECVNLAADLNDLVSSFGPDPGQDCFAYRLVVVIVIVWPT